MDLAFRSMRSPPGSSPEAASPSRMESCMMAQTSSRSSQMPAPSFSST